MTHPRIGTTFVENIVRYGMVAGVFEMYKEACQPRGEHVYCSTVCYRDNGVLNDVAIGVNTW